MDGAGSIGVWFGAPKELLEAEAIGVDTQSVLKVPNADLALVPVGRSGNSPAGDERALVGRLDWDSPVQVPNVLAVGFPRHKLRPAPGRPKTTLREVHHAYGAITVNAKTDTFELTVLEVPEEDPEPIQHSPWEGMSGAAVWSGQRLIGVVGQHHPAGGCSTLTVRPIQELFTHATADQLKSWRAALPQLPAAADRLGLVTPRTPGNFQLQRARKVAEALTPPVLIDRDAELTALDEFAGSDAQWLWIKGEAFAGKTALLASFALYPPDDVDVVACFLRRTIGDNTAVYALDVLNRQLAALADQRGHPPSLNLSDRIYDFGELLGHASDACVQRGRRLLVLIDGLDEYDPTPAKLHSWLPNAATLPREALLLVSSRSGSDVHIPPDHPLFTHARSIPASEAATEIQRAAHDELDHISKSPGSFVYPLACCLAAADGGLTAGELTVLVKRRGRDAEIGEVEAVLGSSLRRSLIRFCEPGEMGEEVYAFAHDTLLTAARLICAADLAAYEDMLDRWAGEYAEHDFPHDTPRYLLRPYTRELSRRARDPATTDAHCRWVVDQLFMVAAHPARMLRLFERTGNPAVPSQEILVAQQTILETRYRSNLDPEEILFRLAVLTLRRRPVTVIRPRIAARIAAVWASIGRINSCLDLAACIEDSAERAAALSEVARALAVAQREGQAASAAEQAQQAAANIDTPAERATALNEVARAFVVAQREGQAASAAEQAQQAAANIDIPAKRARALNETARTLAMAHREDQAASAAEQAQQAAANIDTPAKRARALNETARTLAMAHREDQAASAAERAWQAAADIRTPPQSHARALSEVARAFAMAGRTSQAASPAESARQAIATIKAPEPRARALCTVAHVLAKAGLGDQTASAAESARQAAGDIENVARRAWALSKVAQILTEAGLDDEASSAAEQAWRAAAGVKDAEQRAGALSEVSRAFVKAGLGDQAVSAAESARQAAADIKNMAKRTQALNEVARLLATTGRSGQGAEEAQQVAASIEDPEWRARALSDVASILVTAVGSEQAASAAEQARQAAAGIKNMARRAWALSKVAQTLAPAGRADQAASAAEQTLTAIVSGDQSEWRAQALSEVARILATADQPDEAATAAEQARQAAANIPTPERQAQTLSEVAHAFAMTNREDEAATAAEQARQAAANIPTPERQAQTLSEVA
ncbi:hypothetical protein ACI2L4_09900, partial [Streptomyces sparsogenes]|uniref:hypothetical protein n=1 Tax=Streptomyces sparsogenes TaxID=67365 RepID=UPI00384FC2F4